MARFTRLPRLRFNAGLKQYAESEPYVIDLSEKKLYIFLQYSSETVDGDGRMLVYYYDPNATPQRYIWTLQEYLSTSGLRRIDFALRVSSGTVYRTTADFPIGNEHQTHSAVEVVVDIPNGVIVLYINGIYYRSSKLSSASSISISDEAKLRIAYNPTLIDGRPEYSSFVIEKLIINNKLPSWWTDPEHYANLSHVLYNVSDSDLIPLFDEPSIEEARYFVNCWKFHSISNRSSYLFVEDEGSADADLRLYNIETSALELGDSGVWGIECGEYSEVCQYDYETLLTFDIDKLISISNATFMRFVESARSMAISSEFNPTYLSQLYTCWTDTYLALYDRVRNSYDSLEFYIEYGAEGNSTGIDFFRIGRLIREEASDETYGTDAYWRETAELRGFIVPTSATSIYDCYIQMINEDNEIVRLNPWELVGYRVNPASASTIRRFITDGPLVTYERTTEEIRRDIVDMLLNLHPKFAQMIQNSGYTDSPYLDLIAFMTDSLNFYIDLAARQSDPNAASGIYLDYLAQLLGYTPTPPQPPTISVSIKDFSDSKLATLITRWNRDNEHRINGDLILNLSFSQDDISNPAIIEANASGQTFRLLDPIKASLKTYKPGTEPEASYITTIDTALMRLTCGERATREFGNVNVYELRRMLLRGPIDPDPNHLIIRSSDPSKTFIILRSYYDLQEVASIPVTSLLKDTFLVLVQNFRNGDALLSFLTFPTSFRAEISPNALVENLTLTYYKFDPEATISSAATISPSTLNITLKPDADILYSDSGNKYSVADLFNWAESKGFVNGLYTLDDACKLTLSFDSVIGGYAGDSDDDVRLMIQSNGIFGNSEVLSIDNRAVTEKDYETILKNLTSPYKVLDAKVYPRYINAEVYLGTSESEPDEKNTFFPFTLDARIAFITQLEKQIGNDQVRVIELVTNQNALSFGLSYARDILNRKRLLSHLIYVNPAEIVPVSLQGTIYYKGDLNEIKKWMYGSFLNRVRLNLCKIGKGLDGSQLYVLLAECPYLILPRIIGWKDSPTSQTQNLDTLAWDVNDDKHKSELAWVDIDSLDYKPIEELTVGEINKLKRALVKRVLREYETIEE